MRIEYHRTLVADHVRNAAFRDALAALIKPGETTVADIGAGTGLIGLIAARLGAREVYLYETAEVAGVAAQTLKSNRARNCHLMPCHSLDMQDPPRVDIVVSETLGNYALEEDIVETLNDARARHLKPGGCIIPARLEQLVAPVVSARFNAELDVWQEVGPRLSLPLDFAIARTMSLNNAYVRTIGAADLWPGRDVAQVWDRIDFSARNRPNRNGEASWKARAATQVHGFASWWRAELAPAVALSTAPDAPRTHWEQLYFPLARPLDVAAGETVGVSLRSRSSREAGTHLAWTATRTARDGQRQLDRLVHDLDKGYLP